MAQMKCIDRPSEIKDNILWDLLSKLLEFDPNKRITAAEALQHPYFTSPEANSDISKEQHNLVSLAAVAELEGDKSITEFDKDPTFIVAESIIKQFLLSWIRNHQPQELSELDKNIQEREKSVIQQDEEVLQTTFAIDSQKKENQNNKFFNANDEQNEDIYNISHSQSKLDQYSEQNLQFVSPYQQISQNLQLSQLQQQTQSQPQIQSSIYSHHSNLIFIKQSKQVSLSYAATKKQIQIENDFMEQNASLEDIKIQIGNFENLQIIERDVIGANLYKLLNGYKQNCEKAIQLGIIDSILNIINTFSIENQYPIYLRPLELCLQNIPSLLEQKKFREILLEWIKRFLYFDEEINILCLIGDLFSFIKIIGNNTEIEDPHPFREELERNGSITKLFKKFNNNNYEHKDINEFSALSIGYLYKAFPLPSQYGLQIINHLKKLRFSNDKFFKENSFIAIYNLAKCKDNHYLILQNEYLKVINNILYNQEEQRQTCLAILIIIYISKYGNEETDSMVFNTIPLDTIQLLTKSNDEDLAYNAKVLFEALQQYKKQKESEQKDINSKQVSLTQSNFQQSNELDQTQDNDEHGEQEMNEEEMLLLALQQSQLEFDRQYTNKEERQEKEKEQYMDDEEKMEYALKLQYQQESYKHYIDRNDGQLTSLSLLQNVPKQQLHQQQINQQQTKIKIDQQNQQVNENVHLEVKDEELIDFMDEKEMLIFALKLSEENEQEQQEENQ